MSGQFLASTGTDGFLNIYELSEDSATLLKKVKIADKKVGPNDRMNISWLESESILVSGNKLMGVVTKGETEKDWELDHQEMISHDREITGILKISDEIMATHSSEDKVIKIWCINEEGCNCLHEFKIKNPVMAMEYDNHTKCLAIMDTECKIALFKRDFTKGAEEQSEEPVE